MYDISERKQCEMSIEKQGENSRVLFTIERSKRIRIIIIIWSIDTEIEGTIVSIVTNYSI